MKKIKIGSDFSGVGSVNQALNRLGIDYKEMFACDIDKYARQTYILNYGEPEYFPTDVYERKIPKKPLDLYVSTPSCQSFSLSGKRKGENDKRGILFYNSHEFIQKNKPRYFIIENVKGLLSDNGGKTFQRWCDYLGGKSVNGTGVMFPHKDSVPYHIYYKVLNAKHYGVPQNRERIFIVGIRDDADNNFTWAKPFPLVKRLKDVLEDEVDEKYYLSENAVKRLCNNNNGFHSEPKDGNDVASTICASDFKIARGMNVLKVKSATKKGFEVATEEDSINLSNLSSETRRGQVGKGVAQTLDTACNQAVMIGAIRGHNPENPTSRESGLPTQQMLEINEKGTSNALTTVQKDNVVVESDFWIGDYRSDEGLRIRKDNISPCMTSSMSGEDWKANKGTRNPPIIKTPKHRIRRLTPTECFRLMDFNENFKWEVSDTQAYRQAGNSIVVACLVAIIKKLNL